jgi:hypothetical protein
MPEITPNSNTSGDGTEEAAGIAVEFAGQPKVAAAMMSIEDHIKKNGKEAWCALARKAFPPLTER